MVVRCFFFTKIETWVPLFNKQIIPPCLPNFWIMKNKYGHMVLPSSEQRFFLMLKFAPGEGFDL